MKFASKVFTLILSTVLLLGFAIDANAKRMGGSRSIGKQSNTVTQRQANPPQAAPASPSAPQVAPAPVQQPRKFGWGGMLGGLAAGLGLGWLLSHFGLGDAAASFFMGILIFMVVAVVGMWLIRRFAGGGTTFQARPASGPMNEPNWSAKSSYSDTPSYQTNAGSSTTAVAPATPYFADQDIFLNSAKSLFIQLQEASDKQNIDVLKEYTTPELFDILRSDMLSRDNPFSSTQVLTLHAEIIAFETEGNAQLASVKFSGEIREDNNAPEHFEEVWNWSKPTNNQSGWVLAGIQQIS